VVEEQFRKTRCSIQPWQGAGPTGVEASGAIAEIARQTLKNDFRSIHPDEAQIIPLDGSPRILCERLFPILGLAMSGSCKTMWHEASSFRRVVSLGRILPRNARHRYSRIRTPRWKTRFAKKFSPPANAPIGNLGVREVPPSGSNCEAPLWSIKSNDSASGAHPIPGKIDFVVPVCRTAVRIRTLITRSIRSRLSCSPTMG